MRILLLERDSISPKSLATRLERVEGYDVASYSFFVDGIYDLPNFEPHLIISDELLPDGTALSIIQTMFDIEYHVPVIILTEGDQTSLNNTPDCPHITFHKRTDHFSDLLTRIESYFTDKKGRFTFHFVDLLKFAVESGYSGSIKLDHCGSIQLKGGDLWFAEADLVKGKAAIQRMLLFSENMPAIGRFDCQQLGPDEFEKRNVFLELVDLQKDFQEGTMFDTIPTEAEVAEQMKKSVSFKESMEYALDLLLAKKYSTALFWLERARQLDPQNKMVNTNIMLLQNMQVETADENQAFLEVTQDGDL